MIFISLKILIFFLSFFFISSQYPEDSKLYNETIEAGEVILRESIESHPDVEYIIHPDRRMIDTNNYYFIEPEAEDYTIGILVDPVFLTIS